MAFCFLFFFFDTIGPNQSDVPFHSAACRKTTSADVAGTGGHEGTGGMCDDGMCDPRCPGRTMLFDPGLTVECGAETSLHRTEEMEASWLEPAWRTS